LAFGTAAALGEMSPAAVAKDEKARVPMMARRESVRLIFGSKEFAEAMGEGKQTLEVCSTRNRSLP
jgi:hypothetical protein